MTENLLLRVNEDITLRQIAPSKSTALSRLVQQERESLRQWLAEDEMQTLLDTDSFIFTSTMRYLMNGAFDAGIWVQDQLVGMVSLHTINPEKRRSDIGYWLARAFWGQGIMTRCVEKVVDYAFRVYGLWEIRIFVATDNPQSRAIPERLGFKVEKILREAETINGTRGDQMVYLIHSPDEKHKKSRPARGD